MTPRTQTWFMRLKGDETSSDPFLLNGVFTHEACPHETLENRF